jgi:hypothetical protein
LSSSSCPIIAATKPTVSSPSPSSLSPMSLSGTVLYCPVLLVSFLSKKRLWEWTKL